MRPDVGRATAEQGGGHADRGKQKQRPSTPRAYGTALAPIYAAHAAGIDVHVWVSETRPRNQGLLTAWELGQSGVPHTVIADNAAGLLLARGGTHTIDAVIVGADRIAANGDVANKVGTYLKALAAHAAGVPFYVAAPGSTLDFSCPRGADIPIEERCGDELRCVSGLSADGRPGTVRQLAAEVAVANPAFDVTPAPLVSAIICERGSTAASAAGLRALYPEADLGPAKQRLQLFLEQYWGGPHTYSETRGHPRLRLRHAPFQVTPDMRDRWLRHMTAAE